MCGLCVGGDIVFVRGSMVKLELLTFGPPGNLHQLIKYTKKATKRDISKVYLEKIVMFFINKL